MASIVVFIVFRSDDVKKNLKALVDTLTELLERLFVLSEELPKYTFCIIKIFQCLIIIAHFGLFSRTL